MSLTSPLPPIQLLHRRSSHGGPTGASYKSHGPCHFRPSWPESTTFRGTGGLLVLFWALSLDNAPIRKDATLMLWSGPGSYPHTTSKDHTSTFSHVDTSPIGSLSCLTLDSYRQPGCKARYEYYVRSTNTPDYSSARSGMDLDGMALTRTRRASPPFQSIG